MSVQGTGVIKSGHARNSFTRLPVRRLLGAHMPWRRAVWEKASRFMTTLAIIGLSGGLFEASIHELSDKAAVSSPGCLCTVSEPSGWTVREAWGIPRLPWGVQRVPPTRVAHHHPNNGHHTPSVTAEVVARHTSHTCLLPCGHVRSSDAACPYDLLRVSIFRRFMAAFSEASCALFATRRAEEYARVANDW